MPSSGTLNGNNVDGTEGSTLTWQVTSQNVAGNYSTVAWQVKWRFVATGCRGLRKGSANVNGTLVYNDQDPGDGVHGFVNGHNHRPALQVAAGSINIAHNADGSKTFSASVSLTGWDGGPTLLSSGSASWALPVIPRLTGAPSKPVISDITSTSVFVTFIDGTGGAPIDSRQIGYGTNPTLPPTTIIASDGSTAIGSLTPGTTYYFWARTHNVAGFSPWSARAEATTHRVPDAPTSPTFSNVTQISLSASWLPNFNGGTPILEYELGRALTPVAPVTIVTAVSPKSVTGLNPGTRYYFWTRARNNVGWGPWSAPSNILTIAGARVKVGAVWKQAIPYVKVAGVWELARPWVRRLGTWKETI